jgi:vacuolar protein sorting-associated protein 13A/C
MIDKSFIRLKKEYLNVMVDLVVINNQLFDAQFPVLLAPNKKKIYGD